MGLVSKSSNSVRSFVKPAPHVGEQIGGGFGCRAWAGSGGFFAGCTTKGGGELGDTVAQPLTSSASSIGVIARRIKLLLGFIGNLLHGERAALFFFASGLHRLARGAFALGELDGMRRLRFGVRGALVGQAHGLQAGERQGQRQQRAQHRGQDLRRGHLVTAFCATLPVM